MITTVQRTAQRAAGQSIARSAEMRHKYIRAASEQPAPSHSGILVSHACRGRKCATDRPMHLESRMMGPIRFYFRPEL